MQILRRNVRHFTFVLLVPRVLLISTPSFALMELFSIKTILFVIGGSTLTVLMLKDFTLEMKKLLLREKPHQTMVILVMTLMDLLQEHTSNHQLLLVPPMLLNPVTPLARKKTVGVKC
uniref:Uncharacterized protein n=1 Tax=Lepeophtheirus salmonis TaxID=72036 RepID=A0A0K2VFK1_LEPSM